MYFLFFFCLFFFWRQLLGEVEGQQVLINWASASIQRQPGALTAAGEGGSLELRSRGGAVARESSRGDR